MIHPSSAAATGLIPRPNPITEGGRGGGRGERRGRGRDSCDCLYQSRERFNQEIGYGRLTLDDGAENSERERERERGACGGEVETG